jgi:hypothetical protein
MIGLLVVRIEIWKNGDVGSVPLNLARARGRDG